MYLNTFWSRFFPLGSQRNCLYYGLILFLFKNGDFLV